MTSAPWISRPPPGTVRLSGGRPFPPGDAAMFTLQTAPQRLCDGIGRRDFLTVGGLGALGLALPATARAAPASPGARLPGFGRARRCVLLFLTGGPPQLDTWDLKPDAPAEIRGELTPIATSVPGIRVSELLPRLA